MKGPQLSQWVGESLYTWKPVFERKHTQAFYMVTNDLLRTRIDYGKKREESVHVIACVRFLYILVWTCEHWHMHGCAALIKASCVQSPEQKVIFLPGWQLTCFSFPLIWHRGMLLGTECRHLKAGLIFIYIYIREGRSTGRQYTCWPQRWSTYLPLPD